MSNAYTTNNAPVAYEMLRKLAEELQKNIIPWREVDRLFEIWYAPAPRPANERHLVSRNKREGWYAGKDGWSRDQHHRTRDRRRSLRWAIDWPPTLIWIDEANDLANVPLPASQLQHITHWSNEP